MAGKSSARQSHCRFPLLTSVRSHNFDVEAGAKILMEGNVFKDCKAPVSAATLKLTSGLFNVPAQGDAASCSKTLGRDCQVNSLSGSGDFGSFKDTSAIDAIADSDSIWEATPAADVTSLSTSAGVGKLSSSASSNVVAKAANVSSTFSTSASKSSKAVSSVAKPSNAASTVAATTSKATAAAVEDKAQSGAVASRWGRCGGNGWTGATACEKGSSCTAVNECEYPSHADDLDSAD